MRRRAQLYSYVHCEDRTNIAWYQMLFRRLLTEYSDRTSAEVDGRVYTSSEFPQLIEQWCSNAGIQATVILYFGAATPTFFGFHDHPDELRASGTEMPFIKRLASERLLRYRVLHVGRSPFAGFLSFLGRLFHRERSTPK